MIQKEMRRNRLCRLHRYVGKKFWTFEDFLSFSIIFISSSLSLMTYQMSSESAFSWKMKSEAVSCPVSECRKDFPVFFLSPPTESLMNLIWMSCCVRVQGAFTSFFIAFSYTQTFMSLGKAFHHLLIVIG